MTVIKTFNLQCDNEECGFPMFDLDSTPTRQSARQIRAAAKRAGWRHTRDGRDFCPDHADARTGVSAESPESTACTPGE